MNEDENEAQDLHFQSSTNFKIKLSTKTHNTKVRAQSFDFISVEPQYSPVGHWLLTYSLLLKKKNSITHVLSLKTMLRSYYKLNY